MNTSATISLSQINSSLYFTNGNVGINTTVPASTVDISGTFRASGLSTFSNITSGLLSVTNATATNLVSSTIVGSTSISSGLLAATNATATNFVSTAFSSGTVNASTIVGSTSVSSGLLSATNVVGNSISAGTLSGTTITGGNLSLSDNLTIAGTLTTVNITSTNVLQTNVSAGTIASTNATTTNIVGTHISTGSIIATGTSILANTYVTGAGVGTNGSLFVSGTDTYGHALYVSSSSAIGKRIGFQHTGTIGGIFSYDYGGNVPQNLALQLPGGNLGVGTDPSEKLHVSGNIRHTGFNYVSSSSLTTGSAGTVLIASAAGGLFSGRIAVDAVGGNDTHTQFTIDISTCFSEISVVQTPSIIVKRSQWQGGTNVSNIIICTAPENGTYTSNFFITCVSGVTLTIRLLESVGGLLSLATPALTTLTAGFNQTTYSLAGTGILHGAMGNTLAVTTSGSYMTGNVGIGTSSPDYTLDVNGTARINGNIRGTTFTVGGSTNNTVLNAAGSYQFFISWNSGAGYAFGFMTSSNGVTTIIHSSNSAGGNNAIDTTNDWFSISGNGIAIFWAGITMTLQTKANYSGGAITVTVIGA